MNKKIFLAAPFDLYMDSNTGQMHDEKIKIIDTLVDYFTNKGYEVYNAHQREKYGLEWMAPEVCTPLDLEHIANSDFLIAMPGNPASGGVHIELGWASALKVKTIILLERGKKYSNLVVGLGAVSDVKYVEYDTLVECLDKMDKLL